MLKINYKPNLIYKMINIQRLWIENEVHKLYNFLFWLIKQLKKESIKQKYNINFSNNTHKQSIK